MKIQLQFTGLLLLAFVTNNPDFLPALAAAPPLLGISKARPLVRSAGGVAVTQVANVQKTNPYVESYRIHSDIQFRYSRTRVQSVVVNPSRSKSQEVTFNVTLPDTAFISDFKMTIGNKSSAAEVVKRQKAKDSYGGDEVSPGKSAGLVHTRSANIFTVRSKVKASESITFTLTYDELLQKRFGAYEQTIHIDSDELKRAETYNVTVTVTETQNIVMLKAIGGTGKGGNYEEIHDTTVRLDGNLGLMTWSPHTRSVGGKIPKRIVLQYEIADAPELGQVLIRDDHFVHLFYPKVPVKPKRFVFVLDTSSSMSGTKLRQLKDVMTSILKGLHANRNKINQFSIITFNREVKVWNGFLAERAHPTKATFTVTQRNIQAATSFIDALSTDGGANIHEALISALNLTASVVTGQHKNARTAILLLTAGNATEGITDVEQIRSAVKAENHVQKVPIFSFGFGNDVDFSFLHELSLESGVAAKRVHESDDCAHETACISFLVLAFSYSSDLFNFTELTRTNFNLTLASELATEGVTIAGKIQTVADGLTSIPSCIDRNFTTETNPMTGLNGTALLNLVRATLTLINMSGDKLGEEEGGDVVSCENSTVSAKDIYRINGLFDEDGHDGLTERIWALLSIKQLIEQAEADQHGTTDEDSPAQRALDLALRYGLVTPLTSLVIVKPDLSKVVVHFPSDGYNELQLDSNELSESDLTLDDINWLNYDTEWIDVDNGTERYRVARSNDSIFPDEAYSCPLDEGVCLHLKDCILPEFVNDFEVYVETFLCEILILREPYAGACCQQLDQLKATPLDGFDYDDL